MTNPADFDYGDDDPNEETLDIQEDNLKDADTVVTKAKKSGKSVSSDEE